MNKNIDQEMLGKKVSLVIYINVLASCTSRCCVCVTRYSLGGVDVAVNPLKSQGVIDCVGIVILLAATKRWHLHAFVRRCSGDHICFYNRHAQLYNTTVVRRDFRCEVKLVQSVIRVIWPHCGYELLYVRILAFLKLGIPLSK